MHKKILTIAVCSLALATPAAGDPMLGFGMSFTFGGGAPQTGVGVRVFPDVGPNSWVGTIGLDYMIESATIRPNIGAAYLGNNSFFGVSLGLDPDMSNPRFSVGFGVTNVVDLSSGGGGASEGGGSGDDTGGGYGDGPGGEIYVSGPGDDSPVE
jgi:hypothetical protein